MHIQKYISIVWLILCVHICVFFLKSSYSSTILNFLLFLSCSVGNNKSVWQHSHEFILLSFLWNQISTEFSLFRTCQQKFLLLFELYREFRSLDDDRVWSILENWFWSVHVSEINARNVLNHNHNLGCCVSSLYFYWFLFSYWHISLCSTKFSTNFRCISNLHGMIKFKER